MPIQKAEPQLLPQIKILEDVSAPVCQQWGHLVEREGLSLESTAQSHNIALNVLLQLNPSLTPQHKLLSPFHDLVILPRNFSKVDGADVCIRDGENNLLGYDNRKYIPSFVRETLEEWRQSFLNKFDESVRSSFSLELGTYGPNYLSFNIDEGQSKITNVERRHTSFKLTVRSDKLDLADIDKKIREAFASLPEEKKGLIIISGVKKNPTENSYVVTFTIPKKN